MRRAVLLSSLLLAACAATYEPPTGKSIDVTVSAKASRAELVRTARRVLAHEGYQIASADEASGVVSTLPRAVRVSPDHADCGANVGVENAYLKDARTRTSIAINAIAQDGRLSVRASVDAEYRPGSSAQDMTLTCISKGILERALAAKIAAAVP